MLRGLASLLFVLAATSAGPRPSPPPPSAASPRDLPFFYDLYTFRGSARRTAVVAAVAVPAGRLEEEDAGEGVRYRFDVTLVLSDTVRHSVARTDDSVFVALPRSPVGEHLLYTHLEVQAPPSPSTLQRVVMMDATTPGIGTLYGSSFPVPDYSGDALMLSDVALAQPGVPSGWRRGDVTLALLPTSLLPESSFDVYYEIYNLPSGSPYTTEIAVQPVDDAGRAIEGARAVRTRFDGEADALPDGSVPELRHVAAALGRGRYRLSVAITDRNTGEVATRSRMFEVRGWGEGATLAPALPWKSDSRASVGEG